MGFMGLFGKRGERPEVVDLRSDADRQRQKQAAAGISLGSEIDGLVEELLEIDRTDGFLSDPTTEHDADGRRIPDGFRSAPRTRSGKYDDHWRHIRAREIGEILNKEGGYPLMAKVAYRVQARGGHLRYLESCWNYIGNWVS